MTDSQLVYQSLHSPLPPGHIVHYPKQLKYTETLSLSVKSWNGYEIYLLNDITSSAYLNFIRRQGGFLLTTAYVYFLATLLLNSPQLNSLLSAYQKGAIIGGILSESALIVLFRESIAKTSKNKILRVSSNQTSNAAAIRQARFLTSQEAAYTKLVCSHTNTLRYLRISNSTLREQAYAVLSWLRSPENQTPAEDLFGQVHDTKIPYEFAPLLLMLVFSPAYAELLCEDREGEFSLISTVKQKLSKLIAHLHEANCECFSAQVLKLIEIKAPVKSLKLRDKNFNVLSECLTIAFKNAHEAVISQEQKNSKKADDDQYSDLATGICLS